MIQKTKWNKFYRFLILSLFASSFIKPGNCLASDSETAFSQNKHKNISVSGDIKGETTYSEIGYDEDFLTRLRLQFQYSFMKIFEVTGRINATKNYDSEETDDDDFLVDRLYFNWSDIENTSFNISGGRLPTKGENSPTHLRLGLDQPSGTFSAFTDITLDGVVFGNSYQKFFPGKIEFYYASQFDVGYESKENTSGLVDTEIYGFKWDLLKKETSSITLQSILVSDIWNLPEDVVFVNPLEFAAWQNDPSQYDPDDPSKNLILDRVVLGDIYETSFTYFNTFQNFAFFVNVGWSHTDPKDIDELGSGLLSSWWDEPKDEDGFCFYAGLRYALNNLYSNVGLEVNKGSKYWISFSQDPETTKLATRGSVVEAYWTIAPPISSALLNKTDSIVGRIGYQYYDYKYTGSGSWIGEPVKIDDIKNDPLLVQFYMPIDSEYKIYAAVDIYF